MEEKDIQNQNTDDLSNTLLEAQSRGYTACKKCY